MVYKHRCLLAVWIGLLFLNGALVVVARENDYYDPRHGEEPIPLQSEQQWRSRQEQEPQQNGDPYYSTSAQYRKGEKLNHQQQRQQQQRYDGYHDNYDKYEPPEGVTYRTETETAWTSRVGSSFAGAWIGLVLSFLAPILLWWNEGRAVKSWKTLATIQKQAKSVTADLAASKSASSLQASWKDGQLVHVVGCAEPRVHEKSLRDPIFQVPVAGGSSSNILAVKRHVEMLQWVQHTRKKTEKLAGGKTRTTTDYTYSKEWRTQAIPSQQFHRSLEYQNPPMKLHGETWYCSGGIRLNVANGAALMPLADSYQRAIPIPETYHHPNAAANRQQDALLQQQPEFRPQLWTDSSTLQLGPGDNRVGTYRVHWTMARPCTVSLLGAWDSSSQQLVEWTNPSTDSRMSRLVVGSVSLEQMIQSLQSEAAAVTWIVRVVGYFLWVMACKLMVQPLETMADVTTIPVFGWFTLEPGTLVSMVSGAIIFVVIGALSVTVIALAWLWYRPLVSIPLLVTMVSFLMYQSTKVFQSSSSSGGFGFQANDGSFHHDDRSFHQDVGASNVQNTNICPGGSMKECSNTCEALAETAFRACIAVCLEKCS